MFGASNHEQETLGATGSNRKQQEAAAVYSPTTNLAHRVLRVRAHWIVGGVGAVGRCRGRDRLYREAHAFGVAILLPISRCIRAVAESGAREPLWIRVEEEPVIRVLGMGLRSKLRRVAESGRQWETAGDSGSSLLGVFRASNHEQETRGVIGSNKKS